MYHMNMVNLFFGDVILVVILLKQVVNNGSIQNVKSKINFILHYNISFKFSIENKEREYFFEKNCKILTRGIWQSGSIIF